MIYKKKKKTQSEHTCNQLDRNDSVPVKDFYMARAHLQSGLTCYSADRSPADISTNRYMRVKSRHDLTA